MRIYKVCAERSPEKAEQTMNEMARQGWEVKAVTSWETAMTYQLVMTFQREA